MQIYEFGRNGYMLRHIDTGCRVGGLCYNYFYTQTMCMMQKMFVRFYVRVNAYSSYSGGVLRVKGSNLIQVVET